MKKHPGILTILVLSSIIFFAFTANAQVSANGQKLKKENLYGKWKANFAEAVNPPPPAPVEEVQPATNPADSSKTTAKKGRQSVSASQLAMRQERDMKNGLKYEANSTIEFRADNTAIKTFNDKTFQMTWKLKGKGKIVAKDIKTKEKKRIVVIKWNTDDIVLSEPTRYGDVRVTYHRE